MLVHRYLTAQLLGSTAVAVAVFGSLLVAGNALREVFDLVASGGIDWSTFGFLVALLVPTVLPYALPLGLLFAILLVYGRMSAQHEITALRASGFSLWQLAAPAYLVALAGTVVAFVVLTLYAPRAITQFRETLAGVVQEDPLRFVQPGVFVTDFPGFVLRAEARTGDTLEDFRVWELDDAGRVVNYLHAREGVLTFNKAAGAIRLNLREGSAEVRATDDPEALQINFPVAHFQELDLRLPLAELAESPRRKIDYLTLEELFARLEAAEEGVPVATSGGELQASPTALRMQVQKRFTFSFAVISLAAIAVPLGFQSARSETHANLAVALGVALVYFLAFTGVGSLERFPQLRPDVLLWLPNLACQGLGLWMLARRAR
ncbi:MAG: LptF/LptG family permease [Opitutales bacterium]